MKTAIPRTSDAPTFGGNQVVHLKERTLLFRYLVIINLIFGAWYLHWRLFHSLNFQALWLSIPLLLAEIYSYLGGAMFFVGLWRPIIRQVKSLKQLTPPLPVEHWPSVDIFITCYNEPIEMVEKTARAALGVEYPATKLRVYILDDGNSLQMRQMAEQLCLQDLQSPQLQQLSQHLGEQRIKWVQCLQQLKTLALEVSQAEEMLPSHHVSVKTDPQALTQVLDWFDQCRPEAMPMRTWLELKTALGEGFDNVIKHAHQGFPADTLIDLDMILLSRSVILQIWDHGDGFNAANTSYRRPVDLMDEQGRGLSILRQISDFVSYAPTADGQQCLLVIKSYEPDPTLIRRTGDALRSTERDRLIGYFRSLHQSMQLLYPDYEKVSDYLAAEIKTLERQISQQELDQSELLRCRYIARPKPPGKSHHAKAGNINYALYEGETSGEFILTLDADHIPDPQILQRVVPYFYDYRVSTGDYTNNLVAFVQTPQDFYNLPMGDPFGHRASLFYGPIQQGKDGMGAAFYTGTNAILRREALIQVGLQNFGAEYRQDPARLDEFELVGGVSSNSITEDMNTAMRLHAAGWRSVYHHEVLAKGLAPDDLRSTLQQRLRWAQGTIQVLLRENPFTKPGLKIGQQLQYFQTMYSYFSGFFAVILVACPLLYFFTGVIPVQTFGLDFAIHFIPAFILNRLTLMAATWGISARELWRSEQYAIALFPLFIQAVVSVITGRPVTFKVTPKQRQSGLYLNLVMPQITIVVLTGVGLCWSLALLLKGHLEHPNLVLVNSAWAIYNASLMMVVIRAAIWKPKSV